MIGSFFSMILAKIAAVVAWFGSLWVAVFVAGWLVVMDGFSWLFEQVLKVAVSVLATVDTSSMDGLSAQGWGALPSEVLNILGLIGVGTAITIISAAIGIRLLLQLIPFVRLGS